MKPEYIAQACAAMRKAENLKCNDPEFGEVQVALQVARVKLEMRSGMICPKCLSHDVEWVSKDVCGIETAYKVCDCGYTWDPQ